MAYCQRTCDQTWSIASISQVLGPRSRAVKFDGAVYVGPKGVVRGVNKGEDPAPEDPNSGIAQETGLSGWPLTEKLCFYGTMS